MDVDDLRVFLSVVEHGSVQAAARAGNTSRTTLRRRLDALEARLGVPLLAKSSSGVAPTAAGRELAERGRALVVTASAVVASVRDVAQEPQGTLRMLLPVGLPPHLLALLFQAVRAALPGLALRCATSDDPLRDLARADVDLVLHFGEPPVSGAWISRTLHRTPLRVVASPRLLDRVGAPTGVADLGRFTLLGWRAPWLDPHRWPLLDGGGVEVSPALVAPDVHLLRELAALGQGLVLLPDGGVPDGPGAAGPVVPVLADVLGAPCALRALIPESVARLPKGRALLELVSSVLATLP